jgi:hypothetical protein
MLNNFSVYCTENFSKVLYLEFTHKNTCFQYLNDLKERGARIIIGDFYVNSARHVMCQVNFTSTQLVTLCVR